MCGRFFVVVNKSAQVFCVGAVLPFSLTSRLLLLERVRTLFSKRLCTSKFMFLAEQQKQKIVYQQDAQTRTPSLSLPQEIVFPYDRQVR
jgi:hypothetical protein